MSVGEDFSEYFLLMGSQNIDILWLVNVMVMKVVELGSKGPPSQDTKLQVDYMYLKFCLEKCGPEVAQDNYRLVFDIIQGMLQKVDDDTASVSERA